MQNKFARRTALLRLVDRARSWMTIGLAGAIICGALSGTAEAQSWPSRPIRLIVPFAPAGGNDFIARFIAQELGKSLGQPVVVENRPGAGGLLGIELGVSAPADGYTLMLVSLSYAVNPSVYHLKYDPINDITPIVQLSRGALVAVSNPAFGPKTIRELIAYAKANPGKVNYASSGQGSIIQLATEHMAAMAGIKLTHIPYKGGGPAMTDTLGGRTDLFFSSTAAALPQLKAGKLRALGVTTPVRNGALPDVPTIAEAGVPGYDITLWNALIGPKGIPREIVDRINLEVTRIVKLKEAATILEAEGLTPAAGTPEALKAQMEHDVDLYHEIAQSAGLKQE